MLCNQIPNQILIYIIFSLKYTNYILIIFVSFFVKMYWYFNLCHWAQVKSWTGHKLELAPFYNKYQFYQITGDLQFLWRCFNKNSSCPLNFRYLYYFLHTLINLIEAKNCANLLDKCQLFFQVFSIWRIIFGVFCVKMAISYWKTLSSRTTLDWYDFSPWVVVNKNSYLKIQILF